MSFSDLRSRLALSHTKGLRLRARQLASGWGAGAHRAERKGSGVEFAGHRDYAPGDDLRHLDHHALLRHGKLLVRQFHTETERSVHIIVDATSSMKYSGGPERGQKNSPEEKTDRAVLLAAALATIAKDSGDAIGLSWKGDNIVKTFPPRGKGEAFEQLMVELEHLSDHTAHSPNGSKGTQAHSWELLFNELGSRLSRGTIVFLLSDLLDFTPSLSRTLTALCTRNRTVRAAQILSPDEIDFPFEGPLRLRDPETSQEVLSDAHSVGDDYRAARRALTELCRNDLQRAGGLLVVAKTTDAPDDTLRKLVSSRTSEVGR